MRAIEFSQNRTASVVDIASPLARPGEVVVTVTSAGICGSDLAALSGHHPFRIPPLISGHEAGGVIVELGDGVQDWAIGDRVAIEPQIACGSCGTCARGNYHLCPEKVMLGIAEWPGALAQRVRVPASTLHSLPPEVDDELAALVEPMAVAVHSVREAPEMRGAHVVILGGGTIGAMCAHQARLSEAASVTVTDPRPRSRELATALGAIAIDPKDVAWRDEALATAPQGGFDIAVVATAVSGIVDDAIGLVRPRGTIVQVGLFGAPESIQVAALQMGEKRLVGSNVYTRNDMRRAIASIAADPEGIRKVITHRGGLDAAAHYLTEKVAGAPDDVIKYIVLPGLPSERTEHTL